ncbi:DUF1707 and FHA domain-containing protein [Streptomyces sp. ST2-7A]|uniref:DUF1707 and FHA domain-containing protein n=1 Tax=Streptomyces sp. ST2-7A TaxID=2907214 RepID=UPI001F37E1DF|nr:DUF1707 and FHA domain-containing protein [Streptomyces sp. ST2-7A]MCE7082279.1 FHA domain-containing protein [Streptomyces sp. ST2-7A]
MNSLEAGPPPPRVSDAEREHALALLRESAAQGRVSHDTFLRRMEVVLVARRPDELRAVLEDLPRRAAAAGAAPVPYAPGGAFPVLVDGGGDPGRLVRVVGRLSAYRERLRHAWRQERLPELLLPVPGPHPMSIGRAPGSVLRLNDASVSRFHAQLHAVPGGGWSLRDLGSANGTWVNGRRVTGAVPVAPGDRVRFGGTAFRLAAR